MMMASAIGMQIQGSPTKPMRLSLNRANPALLKADTEWKSPSQIDWPKEWP